MQWWAFTLTLDDGRALDWQAAGESPTDALRELVLCWMERLGDAALFSGRELVAVECLGPYTEDELEPLHEATFGGAWSDPEDGVEIEVSRIGDTSKMRRVVLRGK